MSIDWANPISLHEALPLSKSSIMPSKEFRIYDYIYDLDPATAAAVEEFNYGAQDENVVLAAVRAAGDDAMTFMRSRAGCSCLIMLPSGGISLKGEFFSDDFQSKWWLQASLFKGKHLEVAGYGPGASVIQISANFPSGVRNSANGNQRTSGPWAGQASPAMLFGLFASTSSGAPASFSRRDFKVVGNAKDGKDPIAFFAANELDARHSEIHCIAVRNHAHVFMGSYNSLHDSEHFESCGLQPVESGAIMGYKPGFPPPYVRFDISTSGSTVTVTAKASAAYDGYAVGDLVPYFYTRHVGLPFYIYQAAVIAGANQVTPLTIATVGSDGASSATMTLPAGVTGRASATGLSGSFGPLRFTSTAGSDVITLSAPFKFGVGAADMVGHLVSCVKAGGTGNAADGNRYQKFDVLTSRIKSCDVGNDTAGYTQVTLYEPARFSVTDLFLTGQGFSSSYDETFLKAYGSGIFSFNDTDFNNCRWEYTAGYGNYPHTGSCQFLAAGMDGGVSFTGCKAHGANPVRGNFAADAQFIWDHCAGVDWAFSGWTHSCLQGDKGQVRFMGYNSSVKIVSGEYGSWQLPNTFYAFYADAPTSRGVWRNTLTGAVDCPANTNIPTNTRKLTGGNSGLTTYDLAAMMRDMTFTNIYPGVNFLASTDNCNNIRKTGYYYWSTAPSNAPLYGDNCRAHAVFDEAGTSGHLIAYDIDNNVTWRRDYWSGSWGAWRTSDVLAYSASQIANKGSVANLNNKRVGAVVFDTTNNRLMVSTGSSDVSPWYVADGSASVTPS